MSNNPWERHGPAERPVDGTVLAHDSVPSVPFADSIASMNVPTGGKGTGIAPSFRALLDDPLPAVARKPNAVHLPVGQLPEVPGYIVIAELGRGGMGVVYRAEQISLKRPVALKMILAGLEGNASACVRFRIEAEAVARLQHANIVQIHEVGEHAGRPFLSLEYVEGGSLSQKFACATQPETAAARLLETLARAVHYMHEQGVLHRDLKPNNIVLATDGTPKITDFGLAKILGIENGATRSEMMLGTPSYMAPEQAAGGAAGVGASVDVYALGAILYELLTGRAPFQGVSPLDTLEQVRSQEPVPPRRLRRSVSLDLETICLKCLEKEPTKRYATAEALADDLHRFLEGQPILARPIPPWLRLWRATRRRPVFVARILSAAALLGLLSVFGWYVRVADQLGHGRAEQRYTQFVQRRNDALFYGLVAADQGANVFGGASATLQATQSIQDALRLAGVRPESDTPAVAQSFRAHRRSEVAADCCTLILVLATIRGQQLDEPGGKDRCREAIQLLDACRKLGLRPRGYHVRRAQLLQQLGQLEESAREIELSRSAPLDGALDYFLIGEEQYRRGEWRNAITSFNRVLAMQAGHFWAQFFLGVCHLKEQQWEAAKADLNGCLSQQPDFVWAYLFRSFANEKLQELSEAEADFQRALELKPDKDARYVLFLIRGILHFDRMELSDAANDFRSAISLRPEQYNAYLNLAHVYLAREQFEQAEEQMTEAMRLRPPVSGVAGYHIERARHLLRDGRYDEAIQTCAAALDLSPDQALPYEMRGHALLALEHYEQAERSFDDYLRRGGDEVPDLFRARGQARMKLGKYLEAAEDYTRALERQADADIYEHRGWAHFFCDAWKLALRDFSKAIELDPQARDAYIGRGLARVMLGDYRQAVMDAKTASRREPDTAEMMHNIACIYAQAVACALADENVAERHVLADGYRTRALDAVGRTLAIMRPEDRSSFWQDKILTDTALAPIRNDEEFTRLQDRYVENSAH